MSAFAAALLVVTGGFAIRDATLGNWIATIFDVAAFAWVAADWWLERARGVGREER